MDEEEPKDINSQLVKLASSVGGCAVAVFALGAFFGGGSNLWPVAVATIAVAAMGVGIAFFIQKNR